MKKLYPASAQFFVSNSRSRVPMAAPLLLRRLVMEVKDLHVALARFFLIVTSIIMLATQAQAQTVSVTGKTIICTGGTTTLTAGGTSPFTWYNAASGGNLLYTGASYTTPPLTANATYWVSANGGTRVAVNIDVPPLPSYKAVATPQAICAGSSTTLSVQQANTTVSWYDASVGGNLLGTGNLTVSPAATTVYYASFQGSPQTQTVTFNYTGGVQTFTVPAGVTSINIDAAGASGGKNNYGNGGRAQATMNVTPGQVLNIYVGQQGNTSYSAGAAFNGGGATDSYSQAGGGGGGTDIRVGGQALTNRVLVAAGGGGGNVYQYFFGTDSKMTGGNGGGLTGANGTITNNYVGGSGGAGGSQTSGGNGSTAQTHGINGSLGAGGAGGNSQYIPSGCATCSIINIGGGGGGGGYYGGGGGSGAGGGGGSSFTDPNYCQNVVHTQGYQNGNGTLTISYNTAGTCAINYTLADTVVVNPVFNPSLSIAVTNTCLSCSPASASFTAYYQNGGANPIYTWYDNNVAVGTNSPTYTTLNSGDNIFCQVTASGPCFVTNPISSNVITFAQPVVTSFSPSSGPAGTLVTIQASNLQTPISVNIGGVAAIPLSNNGSQVVAMVMPGAAAGSVSITSLFGTGSAGGNFTLAAASPPGVQQGSKLTGGATPGNNLLYGSGVALSADGNTAIVGISGDNSGAGGAIVYTRSNGNWTPQGNELVGTGAAGLAAQGNAVALSADGNTALVGGSADNSPGGAVWVFVRSNGTWSQQGNKLTATDESGGAQFGYSVSLSADGNTAMIGGLGDNNNLGAGWIFNRINGVWVQNGSKLVGTGAINTAEVYMGSSVAMSADGNTAVLGGKYDNARTGAIWVFTNTNGTWTQQGNKLLASDGISNPYGPELGCSVAVSADGNTIFSGGSRDNNFLGAAWVFTRSGGVWTQQGAKLLGTGIQNPNSGSIYFGDAVSLSADGNTAVVASTEDNNYTGAMWVFTRSNGTWTQRGNKLTASDEVPYVGVQNFGQSLALSKDGTTVLAGDKYDNTTTGAAWVFVPVPPVPLSNLTLSSGKLSPAFAPATTSYTASVGNGITTITVTPTVADPMATIMVNGATVASGTASGAIALNIGANSINIVTTAQDGITTKTYSVTITRAASINASLASMSPSVTPLSPTFAPATLSYTLAVKNTVSSMTVKPVTSDPTATLKVNGTSQASGSVSAPIALAVGSNTINIVVTAQDGVTTKTYTIMVNRAASTVATLSGVTLSAGTLSPVFAAATTVYTASVPNSSSTITVKPTATDANATIKVNGTAQASGTFSAPIALAEGASTPINVVVTAQDGTTVKTYTITVTRPASTVATLSGLALSSGTLSPVFGAATMTYSASVPNTTSTLTLTPTATDANATITVNGTTVATGIASGAIALNVGANTITTVVTAQSGTAIKTYTVTVTRAASINASLASMSPSVTPLSPTFAPGTLSYTLAVKNTVSSMTVKPVTSDPTATLKVNGTSQASGTVSAPITLAVGSNTITVLVTAQDGKTTKTYTIIATRASGGADAFDLGISVSKPIETTALAEDGIVIRAGISPNGDGINDFLTIENISKYPDNKLAIMNRNGQLIYEAKGYDNSSKVFDGHSNKNGQMQLPGTYFYQLDYTVGGITKHKTGFIVLKY